MAWEAAVFHLKTMTSTDGKCSLVYVDEDVDVTQR